MSVNGLVKHRHPVMGKVLSSSVDSGSKKACAINEGRRCRFQKERQKYEINCN